jgi:hypothetical protein
MGMIGSEMAGGKEEDLETGLYGQDDISRRPLRRTGALAMLIRVADQRQPQARLFQMNRDVLGKPSAVVWRAEGVKTAAVKREAKRSAFHLIPEEISKHEVARHVGPGSLFPCLRESHVRGIGSCNLKAVLGQPDGVVAGAAANFQDSATRNRSLGHYFNQVEIGPTDVPGSVPGFISFSVMLFDGHRTCTSDKQLIRFLRPS